MNTASLRTLAAGLATACLATGVATPPDTAYGDVPQMTADATWALDFADGRPPMNWWSDYKHDNTCALTWVTNAATGRQSLEVSWDGKGTWMHVVQEPLSAPIAPFERLLVRMRLSSDTALPDIRECGVRIQDADMETFYFGDPLRQLRFWRTPGERELSIMIDEASLARAHVVKHGTNVNGRIDFPLKSFGLSFVFRDGAAPMSIRLEEITCTPLPGGDAQDLPEFGLFEPLYDAATVPMLVPRSECAVRRVSDPMTACASIELSSEEPCSDFGFNFFRWGSPQGVLAPKLPVHESGELVFDVANSIPLDSLKLLVIDIGASVRVLQMATPQLAHPGRHTVVFKLPPSVATNGHSNRGKPFGFFALGGISFHAPAAATGAVARVMRTSMRYTARPADALALDVDTGTLPRIVAPEDASRGVNVTVRNVTDRALSLDVALRLADVRGDDAGWSLSERMAFAPGESKSFTCPVPVRYGTYYVNMTACPPGGGVQDIADRQRAFAHFRPVGATPTAKDAPGFFFGSVCHLKPYFGNEAEIVRMADAMAQVGLKVVRTNFNASDDFDYEWYDRIVDIVLARGIDFDFILSAKCLPDGTPDFAENRADYRKAFERYRGRVRFWEMLNEPDWYWGQKFPLLAPGYAELSRRTATDLRELDPSAQFMSGGFCCFDHKIMGTFQRDAMAACWRVFDIHCFHNHSPYARYRQTIDGKFLPMRRELGITIPWYANETALSMSNGVGEKTQAETLVKKLLFSWSRGAKGYTWYSMRGKGENPLDGEHGFGMLTMRLDPRAVYCAWNTLAELCRNKEYVREVECGEGNTCHLLRGADGLTACLWRELSGTGRIALRTSAAHAETCDIYGNRSPYAVTDGRIALDVSEEPVWLLLPPNADLTTPLTH